MRVNVLFSEPSKHTNSRTLLIAPSVFFYRAIWIWCFPGYFSSLVVLMSENLAVEIFDDDDSFDSSLTHTTHWLYLKFSTCMLFAIRTSIHPFSNFFDAKEQLLINLSPPVLYRYVVRTRNSCSSTSRQYCTGRYGRSFEKLSGRPPNIYRTVAVSTSRVASSACTCQWRDGGAILVFSTEVTFFFLVLYYCRYVLVVVLLVRSTS